jgi:hypothetical protein
MRNVSDKSCRETKKHTIWSIFFPENCAIYKIKLKNMEESETPQMTIQYGACASHIG